MTQLDKHLRNCPIVKVTTEHLGFHPKSPASAHASPARPPTPGSSAAAATPTHAAAASTDCWLCQKVVPEHPVESWWPEVASELFPAPARAEPLFHYKCRFTLTTLWPRIVEEFVEQLGPGYVTQLLALPLIDRHNRVLGAAQSIRSRNIAKGVRANAAV